MRCSQSPPDTDLVVEAPFKALLGGRSHCGSEKGWSAPLDAFNASQVRRSSTLRCIAISRCVNREVQGDAPLEPLIGDIASWTAPFSATALFVPGTSACTLTIIALFMQIMFGTRCTSTEDAFSQFQHRQGRVSTDSKYHSFPSLSCPISFSVSSAGTTYSSGFVAKVLYQTHFSSLSCRTGTGSMRVAPTSPLCTTIFSRKIGSFFQNACQRHRR